jgi:hypothetical protein
MGICGIPMPMSGRLGRLGSPGMGISGVGKLGSGMSGISPPRSGSPKLGSMPMVAAFPGPLTLGAALAASVVGVAWSRS